MYGRSLFALAVAGSIAGHCAAAPEIIFGIDPRNTVSGVVANGILADGGGTDWQAGNLLIELTTGFVYNGVPDTHLPQQGFWGIFPNLQFDTWVGVPGDLTNNVHNFADEFDSGPLSMSGQKISVAWLNITPSDTGLTQIANISLSDDAEGTLSFLARFRGGITVTLTADITNGAISPDLLPAPFPEPGTLALLGAGGVWLGRRPRTGR